MTVTIEIPRDIEARLMLEAQASGVPLSQLVHDLLVGHFEDAEDRQVAEERLSNRQASIAASQMRRNLGLDD